MKNFSPKFSIVTVIILAMVVLLTGCQMNSTTSIEQVEPDTEVVIDEQMTADMTPEPSTSSDVSKSTDLTTIEAEIQETAILDEDFSDL